MDTLDERFRNALRPLVAGAGRVMAAVSGGADSVALLRLLHAQAAREPLDVVVAHVNHAMREAAQDDERFVRDLAADLGLPCLVRRAAPPPRSEEQARLARHRLLREMAREAGSCRILLAHTMDDQAETVLMRLVRGAGRRGLSGMRSRGPGPLGRPLLGMRRAELRARLASLGQPFREDETNQDQRRLRNRVRARLIPLLEEMNPAVVPALARTAEVLAAEDAWLDKEASAWLSANARRVGTPRPGSAAPPPAAQGMAASRPALASLDPALARRVGRLLLREAGADPRGLPLAAVDRLVELSRGTEAVRIDLPGGMQAVRDGLDLLVHRAPAALHRPQPPWEVRLTVPGRAVLPGSGLVLVAHVAPAGADFMPEGGARRAILDADQLGENLTIRTRRAGDVFYPLGAPGPRKLKRFLIDRKVPLSRRDGLVLVAGRHGIAWVAGVEIGHADRLTSATRSVAILEILPAAGEVDLPQADV